MTELLTRTSAAATRVSERAADSSVWLRGALAALWAVAVGVAGLVVLVLIVWAADSRSGSSAGAAIRTALQIWLVAHRVPLLVGGGSFAIAPLGLTLALGFLVARSAAVVARGQQVGSASGVGATAVAVGLPYAVLATFVAAAGNSTLVRPQPIAALFGGLVVGCLAAAWGAARGAGLVRETWSVLPEWSRGPVAAGAAAAGVVLGCALLLMVGSLALHASSATELASSLGGGFVGVTALVAVDLALLPNALACAVGYLAGPGFALGAGTSVSLGDASLHQVPALPLLGALPHGGAPVAVQALAVCVLVAAGSVAGWLVARVDDGWSVVLTRAVGAGAVAGAMAAVLTALAGGPAGPGRMTAVGASPWQTGLALAGEVGVVACGVAAVLTLRRRAG